MADHESISRLFSLAGRTVLVTGARRGIGWAIAGTCAAAGAHVVINDLDAQEFGPQDVRCNAVAPGFLRTELTRGMVANEEHNRWVQARVPLRRWGEPEDVSPAELHLLSAASAYVNGPVLTVDGGGVTTAL